MSAAIETETRFTCESLPLDQWESLRPIFNDEFDSSLPHHKYGTIIVIKDREEIIGFVSLESLLRVATPYIEQSYRHTEAKQVLFDFVEGVLQQQVGRSIVIITDKRAVGRMAEEAYGMRPIGKAWRRDL